MAGPPHPRREGGAARSVRRWADLQGGALPWERYMEIALYDPEGGYYQRPESPFGKQGDFYTAAHLGPAFGRALARWVLSIDAQLGHPDPFRLVELGSGDGSLALEIANEIARRSGTPDRFEYVVVERSEALRQQATRREWPAPASRLRRSVQTGVGERGPFMGAVFANELWDALPARSLIRTGGVWRERTVIWDGERGAWGLGDAVSAIGAAPLPDDEEGTIREVSLVGEALLRAVADHLVAGALLILDYGGTTEELGVRHPTGSIATVRRHRAGENPLEGPGTADLSVDVDFGRLRAAARAAGLIELAYRSQAEALGAWGLADVAEELRRAARSEEERVRIHLALKSLWFGFERFRALELAARGPPLAAAPTPR
ncbi:MAG: SAM-dependent methyltransferase [Thermoplasmata archaeon]